MAVYKLYPKTCDAGSSPGTYIVDRYYAIDESFGDTKTYAYRSTTISSSTGGSTTCYYGIRDASLVQLVNNGAKIKSIQAVAKFRKYGSTSTSNCHCLIRCVYDTTTGGNTSYNDCGDGYIRYNQSSTTIIEKKYTFPKAVEFMNANPSKFEGMGLRVTIGYVRLYDLYYVIEIEDNVTATFHKADGTTESKTITSGSAIGTLPTTSRNGYDFGGWLPCEPCCDSFLYNGTSDYKILSQSLKYTDKISVYVEAYIDDWSSLASKSRQIISCTEGGGWGIGYGADTGGVHGTELHASGYKGIDFVIASLSSGWHSFCITFYNKSFKGYVDDVLKGTQETSGALVTYNSTNKIIVGAEAGATDIQSSNPQYWKGIISNVFIANDDKRLKPLTTSDTITENADYYPIWRKRNSILLNRLYSKKILVNTQLVKKVIVR